MERKNYMPPSDAMRRDTARTQRAFLRRLDIKLAVQEQGGVFAGDFRSLSDQQCQAYEDRLGIGKKEKK